VVQVIVYLPSMHKVPSSISTTIIYTKKKLNLIKFFLHTISWRNLENIKLNKKGYVEKVQTDPFI
jgi:hypothetical protein